MDHMLRNLLRSVVVLGIVAAWGQVARAVPTCPPLCLLPPDPAPPLPPISVPDPPLRPMVAQSPNTGKGSGTATQKMAGGGEELPKESLTVVDKLEEGGECKQGAISGTLVKEAGKMQCNFVPSTLKTGAACHANKKIGTVIIEDGKRYCKIAP